MTMRDPWAAMLAASLLLAGCHGGGGDAKAAAGSAQPQSSGSSSAGASNASGDQSAAPVDTVKVSMEQQQKVGIAVATVAVRAIPQSLTVTGQVAMDEKHTNHIGALADGRVEQVFVLPGDRVAAGQILATIHSHSVHETVGALAQAFAALARQKTAVDFATQNRDRYTRLLQIQAASVEESQRADQQLQQATQDYRDAEASVRMEREHLSELLQVSPASLTPDHLYDRELVPIHAVAAGSVIARSVTTGQVVSTGEEMFVVSNLGSVWVNAAVNEADLLRVARGQTVRVSVPGSETSDFTGTVSMLGDVLDPQTRTVPVRVSVNNPGMRLRPGMFVTANIAERRTEPTVFIPEDALQEVNGLQSVFTTSDGQTFHLRAVTTGPHSSGMVEVRQGLHAGEKIVVHGAFVVKSELLKGSVGEG